MRVISGTVRGSLLAAPPGFKTRPTSGRVKEALFSMLTSRIDFSGISALDICAGTGSLGIEALSRGAGNCCFIESDKFVAEKILRKNITVTSFQLNSKILVMDAVKALNILAGQNFDLIFFDPPYSSDLYQYVPELVDNINLLASKAIFVAECSVKNTLLDSYGSLKRFERRVYGDTALELFKLEAN